MTAPAPSVADEPRPRGPRPTGDFYSRALSTSEKEFVERARDVTGLDEEIALLRVKIASAIAEYPEDIDLLLRGIRLLVYAVQVRYRISPSAKQDLMDSLMGMVKGIGDQAFPPEDTNNGDPA